MTVLIAKLQRLAVEAQEHATRKAKAEADDAEAMSRTSESLRSLVLEEQQHKTRKAETEADQATMVQRYVADAIKEERKLPLN